MKRESQASLVLCLFGAALIGLSGFFVARGRGERIPSRIIEVTVKPGDTLWTIAIEISPETDPRATIESIARLNAFSSASTRLLPGRKILVPAGEKKGLTICSRNSPW